MRKEKVACVRVALKQIMWIGGSSSKVPQTFNNKLMEMMRLHDDNYLAFVSKKGKMDIRASTWHTGYRLQDTGHRVMH